MSSLRHSVLQKTFQKSLSESNKMSAENNQSCVDGSENRNTPGLSSTSCADTGVKSNNIMKRGAENQTLQSNNETATLPKNNETVSKPLPNTEVVTVTEGTGNLESQPIVKKDTKVALTAASDQRRIKVSKCSKQELVDSVMEYQYKYERLCGILKQLEENYSMIIDSHDEKIKGVINIKNKLQENLYNSEQSKFHLEEEVQRLSSENERLLSNIAECESKKTKTANRTVVIEKSMVQPPSSPFEVSRSRRRSKLNQTLSTYVNNDDKKSKESLYEDIVIEQQEILDFYSLLSGISMWKNKVLTDEEIDEDIPENWEFKCKLQLNEATLDGFQFDMVIDFQKHQIEYLPGEIRSELEKTLPPILKSNAFFDAEEGYIFIKTVLNEM